MSQSIANLVSELVGRYTAIQRQAPYTPTVDQTVPQYMFWSSLYRGKQVGYELGALFAKRIVEIDAEWTLGRGFGVETGVPDLDQDACRFVEENLDTIMTWRKDASALGDCYIVVNLDGSLSLASPETVIQQVDALNPTVAVGYTITQVLPKAKVTDQYRRDGRTLTIEWMDGRADAKQVFEYPNLLGGLLQVIPLHNDRGANEVYGHPLYEALIRLFARYDDLINKTLNAVELMGRPVPVASGLADPERAKADNATTTETVRNQDGSYEEVPTVVFEDVEMLWLGEGADFRFVTPGSVSADSTAMLKKLYYLMLEHSGIPEWAWGGAIASSMASVQAQMPAFVRYLEGRRTQTHAALLELVRVWLAVRGLTTFVPAVERLHIEWPELETEDEALRLQKIQFADNTGKLTDATALGLLDLVEDPDAEIAAAREEAQQKQAQFQSQFDTNLQALPQQQQNDASNNTPPSNNNNQEQPA